MIVAKVPAEVDCSIFSAAAMHIPTKYEFCKLNWAVNQRCISIYVLFIWPGFDGLFRGDYSGTSI